jgi:hypothetical protein
MDFPFQMASNCLTRTNNLGASTPWLEGGKSLRVPLKLTRYYRPSSNVRHHTKPPLTDER